MCGSYGLRFLDGGVGVVSRRGRPRGRFLRTIPVGWRWGSSPWDDTGAPSSVRMANASSGARGWRRACARAMVSHSVGGGASGGDARSRRALLFGVSEKRKWRPRDSPSRRELHLTPREGASVGIAAPSKSGSASERDPVSVSVSRVEDMSRASKVCGDGQGTTTRRLWRFRGSESVGSSNVNFGRVIAVIFCRCLRGVRFSPVARHFARHAAAVERRPWTPARLPSHFTIRRPGRVEPRTSVRGVAGRLPSRHVSILSRSDSPTPRLPRAVSQTQAVSPRSISSTRPRASGSRIRDKRCATMNIARDARSLARDTRASAPASNRRNL